MAGIQSLSRTGSPLSRGRASTRLDLSLTALARPEKFAGRTPGGGVRPAGLFMEVLRESHGSNRRGDWGEVSTPRSVVKDCSLGQLEVRKPARARQIA